MPKMLWKEGVLMSGNGVNDWGVYAWRDYRDYQWSTTGSRFTGSTNVFGDSITGTYRVLNKMKYENNKHEKILRELIIAW